MCVVGVPAGLEVIQSVYCRTGVRDPWTFSGVDRHPFEGARRLTVCDKFEIY